MPLLTAGSLDVEQIQTQLQKALAQTSQAGGSELGPMSGPLDLLAHGEANLIFRLHSDASAEPRRDAEPEPLGDRLIRVAVNTPNQRFGGDFSQLTAFEGTILRYLKGTGLGHELLGAQLGPTADFPYTYLVTNYLDGEPLDYSRAHLQCCAATLARLHRLPLEAGYGDLDSLMPPVQRVSQPLTLFFHEAQDYAQPYLDSEQAEPEIVEMLRAVLAKAEARLPAESLLAHYPHECLVHSDHTYENWVVGCDHAYLIDWEWAEIGSPAGDLGHFLSPVTICRRQGYQMPAADRQFFLDAYYGALGDAALAEKIWVHFAAFGAFPALRSLCWTAGYWITARLWYADHDGPSATERQRRFEDSRRRFPSLWAEVMALLEEPLP
ncbi:phosphotransferase [Nodosilinea sp. LEGE 07298]|uniref:phosphotransferase family protein n=1 Tax=Nodosilinea sp. LEGE 07298 TaxID=2777970 RepID=UPI001882C3AD|nr:phosphotransferase [Nodosilinea sp. LEGE 07298]MBE9111378.1 phosphotransferase [Nodosilinea sp. LEGE 07298]